MNMKSIWSLLKKMFSWTLLKETFKEFLEDHASRLGAALAYYTATATAPLLTGVLAIVGMIYNTEAAQAQVMAQVNRFIGSQGAAFVGSILANASQPNLIRLAGIFSVIALLWSASNIFVQLQDSLNTIWGIELRPDLSWMDKAKHRLFPLLVVLIIGILLLVAGVASTALSAVSSFLVDLLPGGTLLWQIVNFIISTVVIALLFGVAFKVLPDVKIAWEDVWPGAGLTALLFMIGQYVLGWYLGRQSASSVYGAAGSLIIFLLWLYYSAQIFLFGAEFTQVYATRYGQGVLPDEEAVARTQHIREKAAAQVANGSAPASAKSSARTRREVASSAYTRSDATLSASSRSDATLSASANLPMSRLVLGLVDDGRRLVRQEIHLAKAEIQDTVTKVSRGAAMTVGGGMLLYWALFFVLLTVALLFYLLMPLWLALLLVGGLALVEGWITTVWARHRLAEIRRLPNQSVQTVRQDVEMVKSHVKGFTSDAV
jgi:membrane protein